MIRVPRDDNTNLQSFVREYMKTVSRVTFQAKPESIIVIFPLGLIFKIQNSKFFPICSKILLKNESKVLSV